MRMWHHGTITGYINHACRCARCRTAGTAYKREWRRARVCVKGDYQLPCLEDFDRFCDTQQGRVRESLRESENEHYTRRMIVHDCVFESRGRV